MLPSRMKQKGKQTSEPSFALDWGTTQRVTKGCSFFMQCNSCFQTKAFEDESSEYEGGQTDK